MRLARLLQTSLTHVWIILWFRFASTPSSPSFQVGTFYPFFRGHAHLETARREPWLFGEPATSRIRTAIRERYVRLLPET